MRPPSLSLRKISGRPLRPAHSATRPCLRMLTGAVVPASTVASIATTHTLRPSMRPKPVTIASPGRGRVAADLRQRQQPDLAPGALVDEQRDPLARRQAAAGVVARDPLLAAHRQRLGAAALELLHGVDHDRVRFLVHLARQRIMKSTGRLVVSTISAISRSRSGPFWIFVADIGHSRDEAHVARDLEARDPLAAEADQLLLARPCVPARSSTNTAGTSSSRGSGMPTACTSLTAGCVLEQRLDLGRGDVLAADLEHVLQAAVEDQPALRRRARRGRRCGTSRRRRTPRRSSRGRCGSRRRARSRAPGSRRRAPIRTSEPGSGTPQVVTRDSRSSSSWE